MDKFYSILKPVDPSLHNPDVYFI